MENRKLQFDLRPELTVNEGAVVRVNFDVEETTVVVNNMMDGEEPESRTIYLAYVVRVPQPLTMDSIKEAVLAEGFDEFKAEEVAAEVMLTLAQDGKDVGDTLEFAKQMMVAKIKEYDKSSAVNEFTLSGDSMWLDDAMRTKLKKRFETDEEDGLATTKLIYDGKPYELPIATAKVMLHQLESYARDCFDKTNEHIAAVEAKKKVDTVLAYDYTTGYPEKLSF